MPFNITSGRIVIGDPCRAPRSRAVCELDNVRNGPWIALCETVALGGRTLVVALRIAHLGFSFGETVPWTRLRRKVEVTSGFCGFYDADFFRDSNSNRRRKETTWALAHAASRASGERPACAETISDRCVVSCSGFGSGSYECYYERDDSGLVIEAEVVFIRMRELDCIFENELQLRAASHWFCL